MLIKALAIPKSQLTVVKENSTLQEAIDILEESGFRCVPILDESGTIFRGNIYKMHIYRHKANNGDMNLPVTHLLKNATKYVLTDSSFLKVFFSIKELPYIAVLDKNKKFYGILTHNAMLGMLQSSWNVDDASFVLNVISGGERGDLQTVAKIINRYSDIASCITLDSQGNRSLRRMIFTLPRSVEEDVLNKIITHLEKKQFTIAEIEDLRE
ncbi:cyclic di-AMP binding protein CbpA [Bavariicoccus seileri]|uniref:cyclic di-AMP binding protein CbpA n=1 Tax=Bavariicoccus seileri TaxID=549685 RepID=UPI0003B73558|nr:cyclic di-AMP binding protein CbpA [Bavariicoccus seileri]